MSKNFDATSTETGKSKSHLALIVVAVFITTAVVAGYSLLKKKSQDSVQSNVALSSTPGIESAPLVGTPSREYVKLQEQQNIEQATKALQEKTAAISTPTRATYLGEFGQLPAGQNQKGCSIEELRKARAAGVLASELACRGCSAEALKAAGYIAVELKNAGLTAAQLKEAGFSIENLKNAGFIAQELKEAGFSVADLNNAGFSFATKQNCDPEYLRKAHDRGVSAKELKSCGAAALKAAGYTAAELRAAGFSAAELKAAGFSAKELRDAGFSAAELKEAGFSAEELKAAGFSIEELKDAGFSDGELVRAGLISGENTGLNCTSSALREAHRKGVPAIKLKECGAAALRAAGYTAAELKAAGFTAAELKAAGYTAAELKAAGFTAAELKAAGYTAAELKAAGFTAAELKAAGFSAKELKDAGFSDKELKDAGFSDKEIMDAGLNSLASSAAGKSDLSSLVRLTVPGNSGMSDDLARIREQQAALLTKQERADKIKEMQQSMIAQSTDLFSSWVPLPRQQYAEGLPPKDGAENDQVSRQGGSEGRGVVGDISKAGTIFYAVLDTGINSDEQSPILATIVHGKYKGSKLLGKFQRVDKKVVLEFNTMNVPSLERSIPISAYAIDPNTARTAMASDVNNHYMLRYGMLFASSFISGLGDAISSSGSTTITLGDNSTSTQNPTLDTKEKLLSALGDVGNAFGDATSGFIDTPPTVKVDAGSTIGLLLMKDLTVPKK